MIWKPYLRGSMLDLMDQEFVKTANNNWQKRKEDKRLIFAKKRKRKKVIPGGVDEVDAQ